MSIFRWSLGKGQTKNFVAFEGDSFFTGTYTIVSNIIAGIGGEGVNFNTINNAVGNATIRQRPGGDNNYMFHPTRLAVTLAAKNSNRRKDLVVIYELLNDLSYAVLDGNPDPVTYTYNGIIDYINVINLNNQGIIFNTPTPASSANVSGNGYEKCRKELINRLRWVWNIPTGTPGVYRSRQYPNAIMCDIGSDTLMGYYGASDDTTYYLSDRVHPSAAGSLRIANNYYVPAILMY